jgi:uncharacterized protein
VSQNPIAPDHFRTQPQLRLIGGRHRRTQKLVFPMPANAAYDPVELPDRGTLWSFTVQRFAPKSPPYCGTEPFVPFAVGYVELPGALIVESRLAEVPFDSLRVGMPMELTTIELGDAGKGTAVRSFAFRPSAP